MLRLAVLKVKNLPPAASSPEKARGEHAQEMSAGKTNTLPLTARTRFNTRSARAPICAGDFAAGTTVAKQLPIRRFQSGFLSPTAFVFAVIPFHEIWVGSRPGSKPAISQLRAARCSGLLKIFANVIPERRFPNSSRFVLLAFRERQVGKAVCWPVGSRRFHHGALYKSFARSFIFLPEI